MFRNWLITGGCGFIGVNLVKKLLSIDENLGIRILDNLSVGTREDLKEVCNFKEVFPEQIKDRPHKVELLIGDIRDTDICLTAAKEIDVIVHLAANSGVAPSVENPQPVSPYGASKLAGEAYCSAYYRTFGVNTVVLRFGNVYGPHSKHKSSVMAKFFKKALSGEVLEIYGDGTQTRDFIYIDDLIQAILLSANSHKNIGGEIFQIATFKETTVNEIAQKIKEIVENKTGKRVKIIYTKPRIGDVKRNYSDISKAKRLLGYEPKYNLEKGLLKTFEYFYKKFFKN